MHNILLQTVNDLKKEFLICTYIKCINRSIYYYDILVITLYLKYGSFIGFTETIDWFSDYYECWENEHTKCD